MSLNPIKIDEREFIKNIVVLAIKKAGSSKNLGKYLGLASARITEYKSGKVIMNSITFVKLIHYLDISILNEKQ